MPFLSRSPYGTNVNYFYTGRQFMEAANDYYEDSSQYEESNIVDRALNMGILRAGMYGTRKLRGGQAATGAPRFLSMSTFVPQSIREGGMFTGKRFSLKAKAGLGYMMFGYDDAGDIAANAAFIGGTTALERYLEGGLKPVLTELDKSKLSAAEGWYKTSAGTYTWGYGEEMMNRRQQVLNYVKTKSGVDLREVFSDPARGQVATLGTPPPARPTGPKPTRMSMNRPVTMGGTEFAYSSPQTFGQRVTKATAQIKGPQGKGFLSRVFGRYEAYITMNDQIVHDGKGKIVTVLNEHSMTRSFKGQAAAERFLGAFETALPPGSIAEAERTTKSISRLRSTRTAVGSLVKGTGSILGKGARAVGAAGVAGVTIAALAAPAISGAWKTFNRGLNRAAEGSYMDFGMGFVPLTGQASSERQRAIQAIQNASLNARTMGGREARFYH